MNLRTLARILGSAIGFGLVLVVFHVLGYEFVKDTSKTCPETAISMTINTDGSVTCHLKEDRNPAKVVRSVVL